MKLINDLNDIKEYYEFLLKNSLLGFIIMIPIIPIFFIFNFKIEIEK
jgi:hypothetical protein